MTDNVWQKSSAEEAYFNKLEAEKAEKRKKEDAERQKKARLAAVAGTKDDKLLEQLISIGIDADSFGALQLVPVVAVTWADGEIAGREKKIVMAAAKKQGLPTDGPACRLLSSWLERKPAKENLSAWTHHTRDRCKSLSTDDRKKMKDSLVALATEIAQSSGGLLGLGLGAVSDEEAVVIKAVESAFEP